MCLANLRSARLGFWFHALSCLDKSFPETHSGVVTIRKGWAGSVARAHNNRHCVEIWCARFWWLFTASWSSMKKSVTHGHVVLVFGMGKGIWVVCWSVLWHLSWVCVSWAASDNQGLLRFRSCTWLVFGIELPGSLDAQLMTASILYV